MSLQSCVDFVQRLIGTRSLPGEEAEIARLVLSEMQDLGYQRVWSDDAGNVIGQIRGNGQAPPVLFNTHLDHVDVGEHSAWPHPPFGAEIHDESIWGRGAMDIKGPLAAQVYGVAQLKKEGITPPGDVYVTTVVQEEVGGLGARYLAGRFEPTLVVIGEASRNQLRRGHRGRTELVLHVRGRSVHASVPETGVNPLAVVARFIQGLERLEMKSHPDLGPSSVTATLIRTDQISANVVPGEVWLTCDWRNTAGESGADARALLERLARESLVDGARAEISIPVFRKVSYTGLEMEIPADNPAYLLENRHPALTSAREVLRTAIGLEDPPTVWQFATDGGHFAQAGFTVIGYGPGDELLAHTVDESIPIAELETALRGNRALALHWPSAV